jgi:hypothetical protein
MTEDNKNPPIGYLEIDLEQFFKEHVADVQKTLKDFAEAPLGTFYDSYEEGLDQLLKIGQILWALDRRPRPAF